MDIYVGKALCKHLGECQSAGLGLSCELLTIEVRLRLSNGEGV